MVPERDASVNDLRSMVSGADFQHARNTGKGQVLAHAYCGSADMMCDSRQKIARLWPMSEEERTAMAKAKSPFR